MSGGGSSDAVRGMSGSGHVCGKEQGSHPKRHHLARSYSNRPCRPLGPSDELSRVEMEVGKLHEMLGHKDAQMAQLQRHADQLQAMHRVTVEVSVTGLYDLNDRCCSD